MLIAFTKSRKNNGLRKASTRRSKTFFAMLAIVLIISSVIFIGLNILSNFPRISAAAEPNVTALQETIIQSQPQFNVDVIYAYAGPFNYENTVLNRTINGMPMHPLSNYPDIIYFNFTHISSAEKAACDAKIEVYLVVISSNSEIKENYTVFFGTNYNHNSTAPNLVLAPEISKVNYLIDRRTTNKLTGIFNPSMGTNQSLWFKIGSFDTTTSNPSGLGLWSAGEPNLITISVQRVGWLVLNGSITSVVSASADDSVQFSLAKSGQGFLYNKIPQDELSQTDEFHPINLYQPLR